MENDIINVDRQSFRSQTAAIAATPGTIEIQNVNNALKQVTDLGVATDLGGGGSGITSLTGDVTGTGPGATATTIGAGKVTLAKMADLATAHFIGRSTAGTGVPESLTVAQANALLGYTNVISAELSTLLGLTGIAGATASVDFSDFFEDVNGVTQLWTHAGTFANSQVLKGGWATANTAGASSIIRPVAAGVLARATNAFGLTWRGKFDAAAIAAGCLFRGALIDSAASDKGFYIGFYGTTFTGDGTKFIAATYDGTTAKYYPSTIAVDSAKHVFRVWSTDGVTFLFAVDGETPITMNAGNLPASSVYMKPYFDTNTAQNQSFDYFVAVSAGE